MKLFIVGSEHLQNWATTYCCPLFDISPILRQNKPSLDNISPIIDPIKPIISNNEETNFSNKSLRKAQVIALFLILLKAPSFEMLFLMRFVPPPPPPPPLPLSEGSLKPTCTPWHTHFSVNFPSAFCVP